MKISHDDLLSPEGYLIDRSNWTKELAISIAKDHKIDLLDDHWIIINHLQHFYDEYEMVPTNRALIGVVKKDLPDFNSISFTQMFSDKPIQTA